MVGYNKIHQEILLGLTLHRVAGHITFGNSSFGQNLQACYSNLIIMAVALNINFYLR